MRFHLRDVFFGWTSAAVLLSLWLWSGWDLRERVYLAVWATSFWLCAVSMRSRGVGRLLGASFIAGLAIGSVACVDYALFHPPPRLGHDSDPRLILVGCSWLVLVGGISGLGLTVFYWDRRLAPSPDAVRLPRLATWKPLLLVVFVACVVGGTLLNRIWPYLNLTWKGGILATSSLALAGTLAAMCGALVIGGLGRTVEWLRVRWQEGERSRMARIAPVGAVIGLTVGIVIYRTSTPDSPTWQSRTLNTRGLLFHLSEDGARVVEATRYQQTGQPSLTMLDWATMQPLRSYVLPQTFQTLHFSATGDQIVFLDSSTGVSPQEARLIILDSHSGRRLHEVDFPARFLVSLQWTADETYCCAAVAHDRLSGPTQVLTWRTADWQLVDRLDVNADATRYLDFSPDSGAMLRYSPSTGGVYRFEIWNYHRQRVERKLQVPSRRFVGGTLSRDGKWVAADQYLCSLETGELFEFSRQCQQLPTFTPNGKRMLYWETPQWFESGWGCLPAVPFFRHIPQLGGSRLVVLDVSQQRVLARSPWVGQHPFLYSTSGDGSRMIVGHFDSYLREHSTQFWEISVPPGANQ